MVQGSVLPRTVSDGLGLPQEGIEAIQEASQLGLFTLFHSCLLKTPQS